MFPAAFGQKLVKFTYPGHKRHKPLSFHSNLKTAVGSHNYVSSGQKLVKFTWPGHKSLSFHSDLKAAVGNPRVSKACVDDSVLAGRQSRFSH